MRFGAIIGLCWTSETGGERVVLAPNAQDLEMCKLYKKNLLCRGEDMLS